MAAWMQWGIKSPEHWLAWQTGLSPTRAKQMVGTARRAAELPATFAAFADGELSVDQVATVAKHAKAHNDAEVCQIAKSATVTLSSQRLVALRPHRSTRARRTGSGRGGRWRSMRLRVDQFRRSRPLALHLSAPTDRGAIISKALAEARDALIHAGQKDVTSSTRSSRSATDHWTRSPVGRARTASASTCISTPTIPVALPAPGSTAGRRCPTRFVTCCAATGSFNPCGIPEVYR